MISSRINQLINFFCDGNKSSFAKEIGVTPSVIGNLTGERKGNPSFDVIQKITNAFASMNIEWLITGNGDMLKTEAKTIPINTSVIESGHDPTYISIPIVDVWAAAGDGALNSDYTETVDALKLPNYLIKRGKTHRCIRVKGHSMEPTLQDSSYLIVSMLDRSEWRYIKNDYIYLIVDREGLSYIKRVRNRLDQGFIVCTSDNLDKANFKNFNLQHDEIHAIWQAEWYLSAKMGNANADMSNRVSQLENDMNDVKTLLEHRTIEEWGRGKQ